LGAEVGDGHVQTIVDAGFAFGLGTPDFKGLGIGLAHGLQRASE